MPSSATPPLTIGAWAQATAANVLPDGPDIQFSGYDTSRPATPTSAPHYYQPPADVIAAAQATQRANGIPASVNIAQWMHEGGLGNHIPPGSNNYWGIKEPNPKKPRVFAETKEYDKAGNLHQTRDYFRVFQSPEEGRAAHTRVLLDPRYAKAMALTNNPDAFVDAIAGTYAPNNPYYAQRIKNTMRNNHLYQYNILPPINK